MNNFSSATGCAQAPLSPCSNPELSTLEQGDFPRRTSRLRRRAEILGCTIACLLLGAPMGVFGGESSRAAAVRSGPAPAAQDPCPTCNESLGLDAFRQSVGGDAIAVIVELQDPPGVMTRMENERAGRAMSFANLTANSAALLGKQRAFIASLPRHGVRALLREKNVRQIDGSIRHIQYQLTYLLNGVVLYVPPGDVAKLRALPEVRNVSVVPETRLLLDKAIDYSLGMQTNVAARQLAVYGATKEFQPAGAPGHPEAPATTRLDGFEGQNIIIAIIDSGVDWRHPMFGGIGQTTAQPRVSGQAESTNDNRKVIYYYALSSPGDPTDDFGHGTLVTSCAAGYAVDGNTPAIAGYGTGQNGTGIGPTPGGVQLHGTAPQALVMEYKVCGPATACTGDIELAIEDAASPFTIVGASGGGETNTFVPKPVADVINLSLGDTAGDPAGSTSVAANNAALAGTIVVAAAGNAGPGPGTVGSPGAATLTIAAAASLDPGSLSAGDLLAANQIPGETRAPGLGGPPPETGAASDANLPQPGGRQTMSLFPAAGGGPIPNGSASAHYVFVDRSNPANTIPPEVQNRIALVKIGTGTFAQNANSVAPFGPAAILLITATESATAVEVVGGIPTFTIGPDNANYLLATNIMGVAGTNVPQGTISALPLRIASSASLATFKPGMAGFSSRGPNDHPKARFRVIKPDVSAPGVSILGAATPDGIPSATIGLANASGYVQASGTSFACPITAGAMALVRQRVRDLGLDSINVSALHYRSTRFDAVTIARALLMNSASNLRSGLGVPEGDGTNSTASINDLGAGHINLDGALHANVIMVAPTLLLKGLGEFVAPTSDPSPSSDFDSQGNLKVLIPSASFGAVPVVGLNATISRTQQVIIRDIVGGDGRGTYNLAFQNNRNANLAGFQISFLSTAGLPIDSVAVPPGGQGSFLVRVTANGNLINADPTEFQWFITATHNSSGQRVRMPFYYRAVTPTIQNITAPDQLTMLADQPEQPPSNCATDTNSSFTVRWSYTAPAGGPAPVGFRVQEATRSTNVFFDDAEEPLVANANSKWSGGNDWSSAVNTNSGSLAYYVPDTANQNTSLTMINSVLVPAGGATLSFLTTQDFEDGFDSGYVELSTDGGATFTTIGSYMDNYIGTRVIDISPYAGQSIKIRFREVSDLANGPPDATPIGWYIENIRITSDNFHTIASPGPSATSLPIQGRPNGNYLYRIAGLFSTPLGTAPGPYSQTRCINLTVGSPRISQITQLPNRHIVLDCLGEAGVAHRIIASTNFTDWTTLGSQTAAADGSFQYEDNPSPAIIPYRFYRLVTP